MGKGNPEGGRPRIEIDFKQLARMCSIQCTKEECANLFGMSVDTLTLRIQETTGDGFTAFNKIHAAKGKRSLRRAQFRLALRGNAALLIWLGKQWLGQEDKQTHQLQIPSGETPMFEVIIPGLGKGNGRDPAPPG